MSNKLLNHFFDAADLSASEKLVLIALADQANDYGHCWPSIETLIRRTVPQSTLYRVLKALTDRGLVIRERGVRDEYWLIPSDQKVLAKPTEADRKAGKVHPLFRGMDSQNGNAALPEREESLPNQEAEFPNRESKFPKWESPSIDMNPKENPTENPQGNSNSPQSETASLTAPHGGRKRASRFGAAYTPDFEVWWAAYPNKVGKGKAFELYQAARKAGVTQDTLVSAVKRLVQATEAKRRAKQFAPEYPHPTTWLNQRRWEDEIVLPEPRRSWLSEQEEASLRRQGIPLPGEDQEEPYHLWIQRQPVAERATPEKIREARERLRAMRGED